MLFGVFAIYDSAISTWRPPVYARNKGEILRLFVDSVNNPQTDYGKHPADYTLFELGTFDDDKCFFDLFKAPVKLGTALEFVRTPSEGSPKT